MKRLFTVFLLLICFAEVKGQILWERIETDLVTYRDEYRKIIVKDSLIYLSGIGTWNNSGFNNKTFYSCYNTNGKLKWRKNGRNIYYYHSADLILDTDATLLTYRFNRNWFKLDILKIQTATGDTLPATQFTVPYSMNGITNGFMVKEPAGGYTIGGMLPGTSGPSFTRLSSSGSPSWSKRHNWYNSANGTGFSGYTDFKRKPNGNYVVLGDFITIPNFSHGEHPGLIEFKPNGDTLRTRKFVLEHPTFNEVTFYSGLSLLRDGGYLFSGRIDTIIDNCHGCDTKYFVARIDDQLKLKWTYINKGLLKDHHILKAYELADSSVVALAGKWVQPNPTQTTGEYIIIKISKTGQYISHTSYSNNFCNGLPMIQDWKLLPDGTSIVAGKCKHHGYTYLARLASVGIPAPPPGTQGPAPGKPEVVYPINEDTGQVTPEVPEKPLPADLFIYDLTGRIIKKMTVPENDITKLNVELFGVSNGIYIYKLITQEGKVSTRKVVFYR